MQKILKKFFLIVSMIFNCNGLISCTPSHESINLNSSENKQSESVSLKTSIEEETSLIEYFKVCSLQKHKVASVGSYYVFDVEVHFPYPRSTPVNFHLKDIHMEYNHGEIEVYPYDEDDKKSHATFIYVIKSKSNAVGTIKVTIQDKTQEFAYDFSGELSYSKLLNHSIESGSSKIENMNEGVLIESMEQYDVVLKKFNINSTMRKINEEYFKSKKIIAVEVYANSSQKSINYHSVYIVNNTLYVEFVNLSNAEDLYVSTTDHCFFIEIDKDLQFKNIKQENIYLLKYY